MGNLNKKSKTQWFELKCPQCQKVHARVDSTYYYSAEVINCECGYVTLGTESSSD